MMLDYVIVGGGIVGLSVAYALQQQEPRATIQIIEKEKEVACHQTGHNSGVIHSGIYYKPGSFKAKFAKAGSESMRSFCIEHGWRSTFAEKSLSQRKKRNSHNWKTCINGVWIMV